MKKLLHLKEKTRQRRNIVAASSGLAAWSILRAAIFFADASMGQKRLKKRVFLGKISNPGLTGEATKRM